MRWLALSMVVVACRDPAPAAVEDAGPAPAVPGRPVEPRSLEAKPDAGSVNPLCEGMSLALFEPSCDVTDADWVATPAPEPKVLAQETARAARGAAQDDAAAHDAGGKTDAVDIVFSIVNRSPSPVLVPLRWDDRDPGKVFSAIAEVTGGQGIYALAAPRVSVAPADAGVHVHSARIRLLPGGRATAKLRVAFTAVERLDKRVDSGRPSFTGPFVLHLGQLFSHVDTGDPAKLPISH